jgi:hypothetical protein
VTVHEFLYKQNASDRTNAPGSFRTEPDHALTTPVEGNSTAPKLMRKASCACGGGCPACQSAGASDLKVSHPNDPAEVEADRVADSVMRIGRADHVKRTEGPVSIQTKRVSASSAAVPVASAIGNRINSSSGRSLDPESRGFMESRFGADFSQVRIHTGSEAASLSHELSADAFTLGQDIYFGKGQYDVGSESGKSLLAHELAHTLQQPGSATTIHRKVRVQPGVDLSSMSDGKDGDVYTYPEPVRNKALDFEILTSMLHSPRIFTLGEKTTQEAKLALASHIIAREGVVSFAKNKRYRFAAGEAGFKMNEDYWTWGGGKFKSKPGVDLIKARADLNVHPEQYVIGCAAATQLTVKGGAESDSIAGTTSDPKDWIPGEAGFLKNPGWDGGDNGLQGENIIYVGGKRFWGHFKDEVAIKPYSEWVAQVKAGTTQNLS